MTTPPPPLRVFFVSHSFPPEGRPLANVGGMQRVATELHAALADTPGVALDAAILRSTWRWTAVRTLPFLAGLLMRLPQRARAHRADVVVFSSIVTALVCWPLRRRLRAAGVATAAIVHGLDVTTPAPLYQWFVRQAFRSLDLVLPVSRATAAACEARGLPPERIHIVPNGVSLDRFLSPQRALAVQATPGDGAPALAEPELVVPPPSSPPASVPKPVTPWAEALKTEKLEARRRLAGRFDAPGLLEAETLLLCSVGRQIPRKGFGWFVREVMPQLPENVHYLLAGEGPTAEAIEEAAAAVGVAGRVRRLGCIPEADLATLLQAADLMVVPNRPVPDDVEGFGVVMLEAGLCGTPSVAAALDGIRDVIVDGRNGHLVPSGAGTAFAAAIRRYGDDRRALTALAARTLRYTARTFNWRAVAGSYLEVLRTRQGRAPVGIERGAAPPPVGLRPEGRLERGPARPTLAPTAPSNST